jgi:putative RNA 2'-phosphotransferase
MNHREIKISKFLSYVLRHQPEAIGLTLDRNGWVPVADLLEKAPLNLNWQELKQVVQLNDKKRFAFNKDFTLIRANQGHSVKIEMEFLPTRPPNLLYHGTAEKFLTAIQQQGLIKKQRHHVHLSKDVQSATQVGKRHGKPIILLIDAKKMYETGYPFYLSDNGVYLVDEVPPVYFTVLKPSDEK